MLYSLLKTSSYVVFATLLYILRNSKVDKSHKRICDITKKYYFCTPIPAR